MKNHLSPPTPTPAAYPGKGIEMMLTLIRNKYYYSIVYSPDDGGYYGEIYSSYGKTVYTSAVYVAEDAAYNDVIEKGLDFI